MTNLEEGNSSLPENIIDITKLHEALARVNIVIPETLPFNAKYLSAASVLLLLQKTFPISKDGFSQRINVPETSMVSIISSTNTNPSQKVEFKQINYNDEFSHSQVEITKSPIIPNNISVVVMERNTFHEERVYATYSFIWFEHLATGHIAPKLVITISKKESNEYNGFYRIEVLSEDEAKTEIRFDHIQNMGIYISDKQPTTHTKRLSGAIRSGLLIGLGISLSSLLVILRSYRSLER